VPSPLLGLVVVLGLALLFELITRLLSVGPFAFTNLELLADFGMLGAAAFGWLLLAAAGWLAGAPRPPGGLKQAYALGLGRAQLACVMHGPLEYFLEFTPLPLRFWMTLGLIVAVAAPRRLAASPDA
jgi:hypothetical protein